MRIHILKLLLVTSAALTPASAQFWPEAPAYPYENVDSVKAEAQRISDRLTRFIQKWAAGTRAPTPIPDSLLRGIDTLQVGRLSLVDPGTYTAQRQWSIRPARPVNFDSLESGYPDPHFTYLLATLYAPFGSRLYVEGDFPKCRFFNFQVSPTLDPRFYVYGRYNGSPEINIVDADIEPDAGHVNPFRVGASRTATNRHYHVSFEMAMGDAVQLNPGYSPPKFSSPGNKRFGSALQYQGPWGMQDTTKWGSPPLFAYPAAGRGKWDYGFLWARYYAMDKGVDALGGVTLPKLYFQLPTGEKFWMQTNVAVHEAVVNQTRPATVQAPSEPGVLEGPAIGWNKQFGVSLNGYQEFYKAWGWTRPEDKAHIRKLELGMTGRGEDQPPIGNYEGSATLCTYNTFMGRAMSLGKDMVIVLTGKMPTFPDTRSGAATMTGAQLRYWSITSMDADIFTAPAGVALNCVMDDEVTLDSERKYVIAYSLPENRPSNATTSAGVTWVNWGPTAKQGFMWRWTSVPDAWEITDIVPNEINLPKKIAAWSGTQYDSTLIGINGHSGRLGWYQPKIHYMTKAQFESLGSVVKADNVPEWGKTGTIPPAPTLTSPSREMTVRYVNRTRELTIFTLPQGSSTVEIFSLSGRLGAKKVQAIAHVAGGRRTFRIETTRPGYYVARVKTRSLGRESVTVYPFVI